MSDHATGGVQAKRYDLSGANSVVAQHGLVECSSAGSSLSGSIEAEKTIAIDAVNQLGVLSEDWDGYGALPISLEVRQNAIAAIESFPDYLPMPEIDPNPNGTISFEWTSALGSAYLELGMTRFSFYVKWKQGKPILATGLASVPEGLGQIVLDCLFPRPALSVMVVHVDRYRYPDHRRR